MAHPVVRSRAASVLVGACVVATAAAADPGYYVVTAYPEAGRAAVEFRYWNVTSKDRPEVIWPEIGASYGINSRWTTGLLASWIGSSGRATRVSTWNWTNDVLLTQGEWPVDIALHTQWIVAADGPAERTLEIGPVLQTDIGRTQLNFNVFFERQFEAESPKPTRLKYQWQLRHRWLPAIHVGAQGFGELGPWNGWAESSQQSHRAGPALFGTADLDGERALNLQLAYLFGRVYNRRADMLTLRTQFGF